MIRVPTITTRCADCGLGTPTAGEYFMVRNEIWETAWAGRLKPWHALPGQQVLCVGCLETRIGRTLMARDFTAAPCNGPGWNSKSERLRNRLTAAQSEVFGGAK